MPRVITEEVLDKLTDYACSCYHKAVQADRDPGHEIMDEYVRARALLRKAWHRYRHQGDTDA